MQFETLFTGINFIELDSVDSTNNYAANLLNKTNVPNGTVIMAHYQTEGKGQMGNHWTAEPSKNLLVSFVFKPNFIAPKNQFNLSKIAALAVRETVEHFAGKTAMIKWPNDIYIDNKKISGMLIENEWNGANLSTIIGIGINVNQTDLPMEMKATSCALESTNIIDIKKVLHQLAKNLEQQYIKLRSGNIANIEENYLDHLLNYKQGANYRIDNKIVRGKITKVAPTGAIELEFLDGTSKQFWFKEIEFIF
ncbi:MAG: BirA family biotin operon repressor/biotin-[acetyl-CoA-carboxylase] ligase [Flavobacteriales bacterium]|jgi:BirA family biotin operon repressor/biotin-[acetyl-CoA-carboxylase] ligase